MSKEDTRNKLLAAAVAVFGERGYEGTTTREVAERAGVNEVTLFRHFGNKLGLFEALLEATSPAAMLTPALERALTGELAQDLATLARAYLAVSLPRAPMVRVGLLEAHRSPEFARLIKQVKGRLATHLAAHLERLAEQGALPPGPFALQAKLFYGMLFSCVLQHAPLPTEATDATEASAPAPADPATVEAYVHACVSLFVGGLTRPLAALPSKEVVR